MSFKVMILPGDGIGVEVTREAVKVLSAVGKKYDIELEYEEELIGGACLDKEGVPVTESVLNKCIEADAVLLGAIGGTKWDNNSAELRPEKGLLALRKKLNTFINLRPVQITDSLTGSSPLKPEVLKDVDILIVRELTGGLYFGRPKFIKTGESRNYAVDTMEYSSEEIERIAIVAFKAAMDRKKKVTSVDKANILATSQLWRKTVSEVAQGFPDITLEHMLVDNCAMQLIANPAQFDVILTENTFGDILSDEASMLSGSLGMLPSASLGNLAGLYEPVHGSAPDITGKDIANPIGSILSTAMLLRHSFQLNEPAEEIENAVSTILEEGYRTRDIFEDNMTLIGTTEFGDKITEIIK